MVWLRRPNRRQTDCSSARLIRMRLGKAYLSLTDPGGVNAVEINAGGWFRRTKSGKSIRTAHGFAGTSTGARYADRASASWIDAGSVVVLVSLAATHHS